MKKFLSSKIFVFVLGAIIFSGITGVVAYDIAANNVGYEPSDSTWEVDNVKDAVDDLYNLIGNSAKLVTYAGNVNSGININVEIGSYIITSSPASTFATGADTLVQSLNGGSFNGIGTYTSVFKATSTVVNVRTDNGTKLSYVVIK